MRFVVDSMLGTLARKLRIFGFDSLYYNEISDDDLLTIALNERRILLTADKELSKRALKANARCILLNSNDEDNMVKILSYLNIGSIKLMLDNSRCPLCNNILASIDKYLIRDKVPSKVYDNNDEFYLCNRCIKVYWRGSHIKKIAELERRVNARLANSR